MKALLIALGFFLETSLAFSQAPDPRDSIILESKMVTPGAHLGPSTDTASYLYIRVFITNKDSLTYINLPLLTTSTSGGAYAIVARPRNFGGVVNPLTNTLRYFPVTSFVRYNSNSPDTFSVGAGFDPVNPATIEPPNPARKAVWEFKFDSVCTVPGTFELDSVSFGVGIWFTNTVLQDVRVNFVKSVITVPVAPKGDLNWDLALTAADVVLLLDCIFCSNCDPPPVGTAACDLNCDGMRTPADVVLHLLATFSQEPFPC